VTGQNAHANSPYLEADALFQVLTAVHDQRAIIPCFGSNFDPKQGIIARCRTQAPAGLPWEPEGIVFAFVE
jgi:hypothetical protein